MGAMNSKYYHADDHRPVTAESYHDAAEIFAQRKARRLFGRRGQVAALQAGAYAQDGSCAEYQAFVGYPSGLRETTGRNVHFTIYYR